VRFKLKVLVGALVLAAFSAAGAFAAPVSRQVAANKPCVPNVSVVVTGKAAANGSTTTLSLTVTGGNRFAKILFHNTTTNLTVQTNAKTHVTVSGKPSTLTSVKQGDHVVVTYKTCLSNVSPKSPHLASANALASFLSGLLARDIVATG